MPTADDESHSFALLVDLITFSASSRHVVAENVANRRASRRVLPSVVNIADAIIALARTADQVEMSSKSLSQGPEWPTIALILATYAAWAAATIGAATLSLWVAVPVLMLVITLHSSLQHEVVHGHPLTSRSLSEALVFLPVGLAIPYLRFRDLHIEHHRDAILTDPYDDPESNYLDPAAWARLSGTVRAAMMFNNTLLGRMMIGPLVSMFVFLRQDLALVRAGDLAVHRAWAMHLAGLVPVALWIGFVGTMPLWAYLLAAYLGLSVLKIRTFLEHQAHERASGRTVIIEDRGPLAFLFLNNNFHAVHHAHPGVVWYRLPALFDSRRTEYLHRNFGYCYGSYSEVLRLYLLRRKDPVPHPLREAD